MKEQAAMVTGANSGIGRAASILLAHQGYRTILLCRNRNEGENAVNFIKESTGNSEVYLIIGDFLSLNSVKFAAYEFGKNFDRLDILINNAGNVFFKRTITEDRYEANFSVNYLAHFYLTNLLFPYLKKAAPSRIINIVGSFYKRGEIHLEDIQDPLKFSPTSIGGNLQLAKAYLTYELSRRWAQYNITANGADPGAVRTKIQKKLPNIYKPLVYPMLPFFSKPEKGADTAVYLATSDEIKKHSGYLFKNRKPIKTLDSFIDREIAKKLWEKSLSLCGLKPDES